MDTHLYEARGAAGKHDQLPRLMQELKAADVGIVLTVGYPAAVTAKGSGIPTVIAGGAGDPVATGLVESLARSGGTVTGISDNAAMLSTKRLGLLKEVSPQLRRVAMLWNKDDLAMSLRVVNPDFIAGGGPRAPGLLTPLLLITVGYAFTK